MESSFRYLKIYPDFLTERRRYVSMSSSITHVIEVWKQLNYPELLVRYPKFDNIWMQIW